MPCKYDTKCACSDYGCSCQQDGTQCDTCNCSNYRKYALNELENTKIEDPDSIKINEAVILEERGRFGRSLDFWMWYYTRGPSIRAKYPIVNEIKF